MQPVVLPLQPKLTKTEKMQILDRLAWSDMFETFLANKYTAAKRFGLEGAESLIPGMKFMIDTSADLGVGAITLGMPHRGRLNVLGNVVRKPLAQIFSEFSGKMPKAGEVGGWLAACAMRACVGGAGGGACMRAPCGPWQQRRPQAARARTHG